MLKKLKHLFLFFIVFVYIVFEELIWDLVVVPIYLFVQSLKVHDHFLEYIEQRASRYTVLIFFLMPFVLEEILGVFAGILFAQMHVVLAIEVYLLKIPLVFIAFATLKVGRSKLDSFAWFAITYAKTTQTIDRIKASEIYVAIHNMAVSIK